jgi:hypothetical protein
MYAIVRDMRQWILLYTGQQDQRAMVCSYTLDLRALIILVKYPATSWMYTSLTLMITYCWHEPLLLIYLRDSYRPGYSQAPPYISLTVSRIGIRSKHTQYSSKACSLFYLLCFVGRSILYRKIDVVLLEFHIRWYHWFQSELTLSETKHSDGTASTNSEHCRLLSLLRLILALFLGFMRRFIHLV